MPRQPTSQIFQPQNLPPRLELPNPDRRTKPSPARKPQQRFPKTNRQMKNLRISKPAEKSRRHRDCIPSGRMRKDKTKKLILPPHDADGKVNPNNNERAIQATKRSGTSAGGKNRRRLHLPRPLVNKSNSTNESLRAKPKAEPR